MPESSVPSSSDDFALLPPASPLHRLRAITVDLAKRLDGLLGSLEDEKGSARLQVEVRRGELTTLDVERRFRLDS